MDNKDIAGRLSTIASLMELNGEGEFKVRGYSNAVYNIERITQRLDTLSISELEKLTGIGKSIASKIDELNRTKKMQVLEELMKKTPPGLLDLLKLKGLGTKKIRTLWNELGITTIEELEDAADQNRVSKLKGFGTKMEEKIKDMIAFHMSNRSKVRIDEASHISDSITEILRKAMPKSNISETGQVRRKMEVSDVISLLVGVDDPENALNLILGIKDFKITKEHSSPYVLRGCFKDYDVPVHIHICDKEVFQEELFLTTGSQSHLAHSINNNGSLYRVVNGGNFKDEASIYGAADLPYIEPELRENHHEFHLAATGDMPRLIQDSDLKGILHNHTNYSDGKHSLLEMAEHCKTLGYEYLGVSDHSKFAGFYANGLDEDRVAQQHQEIEELNQKMSPFKIFKGIEADILPDGEVDFDPETLSKFDFVVASIHSVLNMDVVKATERLIKAVSNPYTTILGHMTGRLLLIRDGYPIDHRAVIDACAEKKVVIEINSHPNRLDIDWRWLPYALEKKVMISINPDAHSKEGYQYMKYGVSVGRKGGVTASQMLNAKSLSEIDDYFKNRKDKINRG